MGEKLKTQLVLGDVSLASVPPYIQEAKSAPWLFREYFYSLYTFEALQKLHLGKSKLLTPCFVSFGGYATLCSKEAGSVR